MSQHIAVRLSVDEANQLINAISTTLSKNHTRNRTSSAFNIDILTTVSLRTQLEVRYRREHPITSPTELKIGEKVRIRWTGDRAVPQYKDGVWVQVTGIGRTRIQVSDGQFWDATITTDHISEVQSMG